jgi:hypothetical protein
MLSVGQSILIDMQSLELVEEDIQCSFERDFETLLLVPLAQRQLMHLLPRQTLQQDHDTPKKSLRERNNEVLERIYIGRRFKNDAVRSAFP